MSALRQNNVCPFVSGGLCGVCMRAVVWWRVCVRRGVPLSAVACICSLGRVSACRGGCIDAAACMCAPLRAAERRGEIN